MIYNNLRHADKKKKTILQFKYAILYIFIRIKYFVYIRNRYMDKSFLESVA